MPAEAVLLVSEEKLKSRFWWGFFVFVFVLIFMGNLVLNVGN